MSDFSDHKTDGLNRKQRMFCHEYIVDLNGTKSAIRAGYSENSAKEIACELLTKPHIKAKIQQLMDLRAKRCEITADKVLNELSKIGFADVRKIFGANETLLTPSEMDDDISAAIQSIKVVTRASGEEDEKGNKIIDHVHEIKLSDKRAALESLGKHLKIFNDTVEHDATDALKSLIARISGNTIKPND